MTTQNMSRHPIKINGQVRTKYCKQSGKLCMLITLNGCCWVRLGLPDEGQVKARQSQIIQSCYRLHKVILNGNLTLPYIFTQIDSIYNGLFSKYSKRSTLQKCSPYFGEIVIHWTLIKVYAQLPKFRPTNAAHQIQITCTP